jgi:hypothetical protein
MVEALIQRRNDGNFEGFLAHEEKLFKQTNDAK